MKIILFILHVIVGIFLIVVAYVFVLRPLCLTVWQGCKVLVSFFAAVKEKFLACFFEIFGERIVDNQYEGHGNWLSRKGWRITVGKKVFYHWFEDYN